MPNDEVHMTLPKMTEKKAKPTTTSAPAAKKQPNVLPLVQEAPQVTWLLKGGLNNVQLAYVRVGTLLAQVRDRKLRRGACSSQYAHRPTA